MQDADLFMELAGIAGVFVGFGALIAVRSGGASGWEEVAGVRGVVSMAALTIVAALAPVTLSRYELTEHQLWMLSAGDRCHSRRAQAVWHGRRRHGRWTAPITIASGDRVQP